MHSSTKKMKDEYVEDCVEEYLDDDEIVVDMEQGSEAESSGYG